MPRFSSATISGTMSLDARTRASIVNGAWSLDTYDGDNQRIARWDANGTYITIQAGGRPLTSFNPVPGPLNWQRDSIYLGSQLIATLQPWGEGDFEVQFFHQDAVGSVRAVTDWSGTTRDRYDYGAFGEGPGVTFSGEKQRFAGTERDWETLLDYMGARYSRSVTGRFNAVDPGHANGSITRPQSWNAYVYASNNPLRFVDPTGLSDSPIGGDKDLGLNLLISDSAPGMFDLDDFNAWADDYVWNNEYITPPSSPQTVQAAVPPPSSTDPQTVTSNITCSQLAAGQTDGGTVGSWLSGVATAQLMTSAWILGVGNSTMTFGPTTVQSRQMLSAYGLSAKVAGFLSGGPSSGLQTFGLGGLFSSGLNPTAQFVGSYRWKMARTPSNLNITLTNSTTLWSGAYHAPVFSPNPPLRSGWAPMGRVDQTFQLVLRCPR